VPTERLASIVQTRTITAQEADNGRVCEYRKRPGSNIAQKYCYTLQERLANQEANDELVRRQLEDLQRDQRLREEMQRQMEMERRRREAAAFGVRQP
jgi:L-fucose isomerase-like protein